MTRSLDDNCIVCINTVEMKINLDPSSRAPIYRQLFEQIQSRVARGEMTEGERLPSVRELALGLRINPNTVARAYGELEREGLVVRQQGRGVFVARPELDLGLEARRRQLAQDVHGLLVAGWKLGFSADELIEMVTRHAKRFAEEREK